MATEKQTLLNLEHAKNSYSNAQEVIRFVDTKTSVMTGVVTITTGLPFACMNLLISSGTSSVKSCFDWYIALELLMKLGIAVPSLLGILFGVFSLLASTSGLKSRAPAQRQPMENIYEAMVRFITFKFRRLSDSESKPKKPQIFTALFPYHTSTDADEVELQLQRLSEAKFTPLDILSEYTAQLQSVGSILHTKIQRNRDAVHWFEWQLGCYFLALLMTVLSFFICPVATSTNNVLISPLGKAPLTTTVSSGQKAMPAIQPVKSSATLPQTPQP